MEKVAVYLTKEEINFLWDVTQKGIPAGVAFEEHGVDGGLTDNLRTELERGAHYLTK